MLLPEINKLTYNFVKIPDLSITFARVSFSGYKFAICRAIAPIMMAKVILVNVPIR